MLRKPLSLMPTSDSIVSSDLSLWSHLAFWLGKHSRPEEACKLYLLRIELWHPVDTSPCCMGVARIFSGGGTLRKFAKKFS